jgi:hypothetical protein
MDIHYIVLGYRLKNYYNILVILLGIRLAGNEQLDRWHHRMRIVQAIENNFGNNIIEQR